MADLKIVPGPKAIKDSEDGRVPADGETNEPEFGDGDGGGNAYKASEMSTQTVSNGWVVTMTQYQHMGEFDEDGTQLLEEVSSAWVFVTKAKLEAFRAANQEDPEHPDL